MKIRPDEVELRGEWRTVAGTVEADETCRRIEALTSTVLHEMARDSSGWDALYVDPEDGRYWELIYASSEWHGGGPPILTCISKQEASEKYGVGE